MKSWLPYGVLGIVTACAVIASLHAGLFAGFDRFISDNLFSQKKISSDIIIVSIDNESIQKIGQWPWPRAVFSQFFNVLQGAPPRAVSLDVVFADPSRLGPADDAVLASTLNHIRYQLILPVEFSNGEFISTLPQFIGTHSIGHVNIIADPDGVVRTFPARVTSGSISYLSLAEETVKASGQPFMELGEGVHRIVFAARPGFIRHIPFWYAMTPEGVHALEGKIVFVGSTASDLHDEKPTPLAKGIPMPGVEIQATIGNMMREGYSLTPLAPWISYAWIALLALVSAVGFAFFRSTLGPIVLSLVLLISSLVAIIILFNAGILVSAVHTFLALILTFGVSFSYRYATAEREKDAIKKVFSKYVSSDVLKEILKNPKKVSLGGEEKEITLLFSDIRGFTTLSEQMDPRELVRILNIYFTAMTAEVLRHGGVLDKYIGDAIMAFWGAPIEDESQADKAIQAAQGMLVALEKVNAELKRKGDPEIKIGIGLYTGRAIVGNVGSDLRFDYTAIGDTVNAASRLEGVTKEYKVPIVIGETTKHKAKGIYPFRALGSVAVKGRAEPIEIYTLE